MQRPRIKYLFQHLPERIKGNHCKNVDQDSSFEVTKFREPNKTDSLTKKSHFIKNCLTWFSKERVEFKTAQLNTAQTDKPLIKKFSNLK
jgi:hypothetical protein